MVACYRCTRRNETGRRDTDQRTCLGRAARRRHQRVAMAVFAETVEAAVEANSKGKEKAVCEEDVCNRIIGRQAFCWDKLPDSRISP